MNKDLAVYGLLGIALVGSFALVAVHSATWEQVQGLVFGVVGAVAGIAQPATPKPAIPPIPMIPAP